MLAFTKSRRRGQKLEIIFRISSWNSCQNIARTIITAELVLHSAKEYIAHRLFHSVEELPNLLDKLLNQGGLIIKWKRNIKNKGNAVIAS